MVSASPAIPLSINPIFSLSSVDITTTHQYYWGKNIDIIRNNINNRIIEKFNKPTNMSEYGVDCCAPSDCYSSEGTDNEFHNTLWASAFSGSFETSLFWFFDSKLHHANWGGGYTHIKYISKFIGNTNFVDPLNSFSTIGNSYAFFEGEQSSLINSYSPNPVPHTELGNTSPRLTSPSTPNVDFESGYSWFTYFTDATSDNFSSNISSSDNINIENLRFKEK